MTHCMRPSAGVRTDMHSLTMRENIFIQVSVRLYLPMVQTPKRNIDLDIRYAVPEKYLRDPKGFINIPEKMTDLHEKRKEAERLVIAEI